MALNRTDMIEATYPEEDARPRVFRLQPRPFIELRGRRAEVLMHGHSTHASSSQSLRITPGDRQALRLLAAGHSKAELAATLGLATREVETQLARLFAAMGAATLAEAIAAAERRGLLA